MKKLGISYCLTNFERYWDWFDAEGIERVELNYKKNNTEDMAACDGLVLTGGVDVNCRLYGEPDTRRDFDPYSDERDAFEAKLFHHAQQNNIPLLAICRGLQLVNVLLGGKLVQEIDNDFPGAEQVHRKPKGGHDRSHEIIIEPGTLLSDIAGVTAGTVNSAHHQCARTAALGHNLQPNAWYRDGNGTTIIEGLEYADKAGKAFMLAVQWHPERMKDKHANPLSHRIKERFIKEIIQ